MHFRADALRLSELLFDFCSSVKLTQREPRVTAGEPFLKSKFAARSALFSALDLQIARGGGNLISLQFMAVQPLSVV